MSENDARKRERKNVHEAYGDRQNGELPQQRVRVT